MTDSCRRELRRVSLDDKYALDTTRAYMTGVEALVRLPMLQHQRGQRRGLHTAAFISGYRGSPVGGVLAVAGDDHACKSSTLPHQSEHMFIGASVPVLSPGYSLHHRGEMDALQIELREFEGVSVIVYQQTCAAEKRRRRKKGTLADPAKRLFINEAVCEACGDCGVKSNCLSVLPLETPLGRKRQIDQNACNKDYRKLVESIFPELNCDSYSAALELAQLPGQLRGFGHIKQSNRGQMLERGRQLLAEFRAGPAASPVKFVEAAS